MKMKMWVNIHLRISFDLVYIQNEKPNKKQTHNTRPKVDDDRITSIYIYNKATVRKNEAIESKWVKREKPKNI